MMMKNCSRANGKKLTGLDIYKFTQIYYKRKPKRKKKYKTKKSIINKKMGEQCREEKIILNCVAK